MNIKFIVNFFGSCDDVKDMWLFYRYVVCLLFY